MELYEAELSRCQGQQAQALSTHSKEVQVLRSQLDEVVCVWVGGGVWWEEGRCVGVCVLIFVMGTCIVMIVYKCDNSQLTFQWFALEIVCSVVIVPCSVTRQCAY